MLVVSRKENEDVRFPNLGIKVEILRVDGKAVRVGIDAPREINIVRGELCDGAEAKACEEEARRRRHDFRNRLNTANLALHLLRKQLEMGRHAEAVQTLSDALDAFRKLEGEAARSQQSDQTNANAEPSPRRALVVEDQANERTLLAGYLQLCGYEVEAVEDGLAAMTYLASHDLPDVVLLDMNMPRMNGAKTISAIRRNPKYKGIKLFAVSGVERNASDAPLGERGVDRWFEKPIDPETFAKELADEMTSGCRVA